MPEAEEEEAGFELVSEEDNPSNHTSSPAPDPTDPEVQARLAVDALYARQSRTLSQAIARYTLHTNHAPPPHYDRWFDFAQEKKCLIDEYDRIHRDFKPFYQLAERDPGFFQSMVDRATSRLENSNSSEEIYTSYSSAWPETFSKFSHILPDMRFLINGRDEPRVAFNFRSPKALENAFVVKDADPFNIAPRPTAEFFRAQSGCDIPTEATGFMQSVNEDHSFLISTAKPGFTTDLYPMMSMTKVSPCFADILFPTEYFYERSWWSGKFAFEDNVPWEEKRPQIYWRGMSNGGMIVGSNYHHFMRFKLRALARDHPDLMDISISRFAETLCEDECDRAQVWADYNITESPEPREDMYNFRYAMDADGTTFSGRFLLLLKSGSLVFKATLFEEYFNDWLRPFEHYVPVKPDLSDLVERIRWANENPEEARLIQLRGMEVAKRVMTDEQNDCYFAAVLLEWAGLQRYGMPPAATE
ncbi:glycosyl transferase family 90-domain-containing protein [Roridomyces roridus]|uniref:Glycosyl transferase family 90-domain-containing protein n=1 Tax=Roridomyces roridus TaxID=1738132 RepID=A0AAD7C176_9AGAR|nr:glycosyl transferase family 90-domain-containing protein [Roridomyces roridus]